MEIEKKTLKCEEFDGLYKNKDLIPDECTISDKQIASRYETGGCRFLFVQNDSDGLVYCYFQPKEKAEASLISRGTVKDALNIYKGRGFIHSIGVGKDNSAIVKALEEMRAQPKFMSKFAQVAKKATTEATEVLETSDSAVAVAGSETISVALKNEEQYVATGNNLIGEGVRMKKSINGDLKDLSAQVATLTEQRDKALGERDAVVLKKKEEIDADTNANKKANKGKVLRLVNSDGGEFPVYLAVGPHADEKMRAEGKTGKDYQSLYVITGGDPRTQKDKDGNIIDIEKVLVDEKLRETLKIRCVKEIQFDKKGNAKIVCYDKDKKGNFVANFSHQVKDVKVVKTKDDEVTMPEWVKTNYGEGKAKEVKALGFIPSTLKANKILKGVALATSAVLVAGALTFGGLVGWGGKDQSEAAKEHGAKRIEAFVDGLQTEDKSLFQYAEAYDANGNRVYYEKTVNGQKVLVAGNKITAIGNADRVFYKGAEGKVEIPVYKQQGIWGQLRKYDEPTILGAAYQLGVEVVSELTANGVPVYKETGGQKLPVYTYLNNANVSDYSQGSPEDQRSSMVDYLTENGNSKELAEKIVASYEEGFKSGLNNGLSNKVENIIGSNDVVTPEVPSVSFVDPATKTAIADKVASKTLQGKKYSADELHVVYSDLDTDGGEQVLFVMASKEADNKYLYKIVLGDGSKEITSENINEAIANAEEVTESIKLEVMFKADKYAAATANYYDKNASGSIAYVSNYALSQNGNSFSVTPTITVYNSGVITEDTAKYTVQVAAGAQSSITEMCAVALLSDYGYFDDKNIYVAAPIIEAKATSKVYNDNEKTLG